MKKITLLFFLLSSTLSFSQNKSELQAQKYLKTKGEVTFTFKVNNASEINNITKELSIINFDKRTKTVKVWANERQFNDFLSRNIQFQIETVDNESRGVEMTSNATSRANTLTFPLSAYPTYADYAQQMQDFATDNPSICELVDFGGTGEGVGGGNKRLLLVKLSNNVSTQENEPKMLYTSSMHGDEIAGFPMMLDLIDYFITAYNDTGHSDHSRVKNLLDNSEVWINPLANPDGTYYNSATNTSVANARRANVNGHDLNRNYPDNVGGDHPDGEVYQTETIAFMDLADANNFVISANFHGGVEVVNYPWDNTYDRHPDDAWFQLVSREYADNAQANSPNGYMDDLNNGITHGADWYRVEGGRQDYMNYYKQAKEVTIELSTIKTPAANQLVNHWNYNREALIDYLVQGTYGFRGIVKDANTGSPIDATVKIVGHDDLGSWAATDVLYGDYYRPVKAGTYDIIFEADCYQSFTLTNQSISDYQTVTLADVLLTPIAASAPIGLLASNVNSTTATLSWDVITGANYDYQYRAVGASTWNTINTTSVSVNLTGLNTATQYEAQVRSICNTDTSPFSGSINFTTTSTVTLHEGYFETGFNGWADGGNDCMRYSGSRSYEGNYSIQLRDNSGTSSAMTSQTFDLTPYGDVEVSFYYYSNSMENGEDFWLRYYNGSSWSTIAAYVSGSEFSNGAFHTATVTLNEAQYNFAANSQFRFQCDASGNNDQIYIDQVIITGIPSGPDITPPSVPTGVVASNTTQTTTDLSWTASTDNIGVVGYDIYQDGIVIGNVSGTSYQVTGLSASTLYAFYIIAIDTAGNQSAASNSVNVVTQDPPDTEAPSVPTNLIATNTTYNSTNLSWDSSTDNIGVTGYDIYQDGSFVINVPGTAYQVAGLSSSTVYTFNVIAKDAAGNTSALSNVVNVTTDNFVDTEAPSAPANLVALNTTETTTDLSWAASTDNVGVTDYEVYQDGGLIANVTGTSYQVTGLIENTSYTFYVIANDAAGNSSVASNTVNETTLAAPTCSDGIQNGDETGVDCGGSVCEACPPSDVVLHEGFFEAGWDGWIDGGSDCARVSDASRSYEGNYSIRIRDNSGTSSAMTLSNIDVTPFSEVEIDFYFYVHSMENNEDFWLRFYDGSSWTTVATWTRGVNINNSTFYNGTITITSAQYNFAANSGFRFQNDASGNNDQIFIDQVTITGKNNPAARKTANRLVELGTLIIPDNFEDDFLIYPNPVKDILNIELAEGDEFKYAIKNILGQDVQQGKSNGKVNVRNLKAGMYFIEVNDGEEIMTKKFIRE